MFSDIEPKDNRVNSDDPIVFRREPIPAVLKIDLTTESMAEHRAMLDRPPQHDFIFDLDDQHHVLSFVQLKRALSAFEVDKGLRLPRPRPTQAQMDALITALGQASSPEASYQAIVDFAAQLP